jgi:carbon starvation protein
MSLLAVILFSAAILLVAYFTYGSLLTRLLRLRDDVPTPAVSMRDDVDYVPIESKFLLTQHFSAIAAAGPIVGPILAGASFGWVPALIWILVGSILIGGIHDMTSLVASIRHKARSIAEVVRDNMSRRSYILFLSFVWIALVYIIVAFTDVTAMSFHGVSPLENGVNIDRGSTATSSILYLILSLSLGVLLKYGKMPIGRATVIFLPLVCLAIVAGPWLPFNVETAFGISPEKAQRFWNVTLLVYCLVASVVPMWLLLQPRGHLGGFFLYMVLAAGAMGVVFGGFQIEYPAFTDQPLLGPVSKQPMFPMMFILIACGACSGFHSIIASGTTSKQLRCETDARVVGYGAMLLEAMVAIVSLSCVMIYAKSAPIVRGLPTGETSPNLIYAQGIGKFLELLGIPAVYGVSFGLMAFTTFVYDTLDVCTRLGRYILQELTGLEGRVGRWLSTALTAGVPLAFLLWQPKSASGKPAYRIYWDLFGASNQLLAALTLLGVTVWLWRTYKARWVLIVTGIPCVFMYVMSMWALISMLWPLGSALTAGKFDATPVGDPVAWVALVLATLGALLLAEALRIVLGGFASPPAPLSEAAPAAI